MPNKNRPAQKRDGFCLSASLGSRHIDGARALFSICDFKGKGIAFLQFVKCHSFQFFGVKEKILRFAFSGNESKAPVSDERFYSSLDVTIFLLLLYY